MKPRRFKGANTVFRLVGGTEDNDLWVERAPEGGEPTITSVWEPTDEDRAAIAAGANIELTVRGEGTPPVGMRTTTVELGR